RVAATVRRLVDQQPAARSRVGRRDNREVGNISSIPLRGRGRGVYRRRQADVGDDTILREVWIKCAKNPARVYRIADRGAGGRTAQGDRVEGGARRRIDDELLDERI